MTNNEKTLIEVFEKTSKIIDQIYLEYSDKPRKPSYFSEVCMVKGYLDGLRNYLPQPVVIKGQAGLSKEAQTPDKL